MKKARSYAAIRLIVTALIVMFVTNVLLSVFLLRKSMSTATTLVNEHMLDIANCAAASVNGDDLAALTEGSEDSPEYRDIYDTLVVFHDNTNKQHLKYIYCVFLGDDGEFYFAVDPDENANEAAPYGKKIVHSDGIYEAIKGKPAVDEKPYTDEWGSFYSAYSPVYDSGHNIVGLVMVDFDASWYSNQIVSQVGTIIFVCLGSVSINAIAILVATKKLRSNLVRLYTEMDVLADDIAYLTEDKSSDEAFGSEKKGDRISETVLKIRSLQKKIRIYVSQMKSQAFNDTLTGAGNRTAYSEKVSSLNKSIREGTASFSMAIFDINGLKSINDENGHEAGDLLIIDAAHAITGTFGAENVYRIGGDEFAVILDGKTLDEINNMIGNLDAAVKNINSEGKRKKIPLSLSKGAAEFKNDGYDSFNNVLKRADDAMYNDKSEYYKNIGGRRRSDRPQTEE